MLSLADKLQRLDRQIRILFVGPVEGSVREVQLLRSKSNIKIRPATPLDDLPLERIFASFIPYRSNVPEIDAISFPNKLPQILARGIPLLITGMPDFFSAPFVFRFADDTCLQVIDRVRAEYTELQASIERFVSQNNAQARLDQFLTLAL